MMLAKNLIAAGAGAGGRGEAIFTNVGTTNWVVPNGVTAISAVCIGGGGGGDGNATGGSGGRGGDLRYYNNLPVTPGETLTIVVGAAGVGAESPTAGGFSRIGRGGTTLLQAGGGDQGTTSGSGNGTNGISSTIGGSIGGGNGGVSNNPATDTTSGGGGAGGYSGNGGVGSAYNINGGAGSGGAGGGGSGGGAADMGGPGGGVNVFGLGPNGQGGNQSTSDGNSGTGGSYGDGGLSTDTTDAASYLIRNNFGAGGNGSDNVTEPGDGGQGAVRVVWPGDSRSFPSTDVWMSEIITTVIEAQSSVSGSITIPASAQAGDLAVLMSMNESVGVQSDPSGWTRIVNQEASNPVMTVWYRIIQSGDAGTTVTMTGGLAPSSEMILFRKAVGTISSVTVSGDTIQYSAGIPTAQTQTVSTATPVFIAFGVFASNVEDIGSGDMYFTGGVAGGSRIEPSATFNENGDTTRQGFIRFRIYDKAPAANLNVVCYRDTGTQTMASFIIEVN